MRNSLVWGCNWRPSYSSRRLQRLSKEFRGCIWDLRFWPGWGSSWGRWWGWVRRCCGISIIFQGFCGCKSVCFFLSFDNIFLISNSFVPKPIADLLMMIYRLDAVTLSVIAFGKQKISIPSKKHNIRTYPIFFKKGAIHTRVSRWLRVNDKKTFRRVGIETINRIFVLMSPFR